MMPHARLLENGCMGEEFMTLRRLVVGAFSAAVFMSAFAVGSDATAEMKPKAKRGGADICKTVPQPECNLFLKATCTQPSKCGGCLKWTCKL
jgi:hypothetical protein